MMSQTYVLRATPPVRLSECAERKHATMGLAQFRADKTVGQGHVSPPNHKVDPLDTLALNRRRSAASHLLETHHINAVSQPYYKHRLGFLTGAHLCP